MKAFGLARLGRDAELRKTPQGDSVCNLSLAFSWGKRDPNTKEQSTQWVDAALWGQRAESLAKYLLKGTKLDVLLDDVHIEEFQTRDGQIGRKIVGRVLTIEFAASATQGGQQPPPSPPPPPPPTLAVAARPMPTDYDDDIPF